MATTVQPVLLAGSCHCKAVTFTLETTQPYPFMICHCSVDRKTAGFGCCNLGGDFTTLKVTGKENVKTYRSKLEYICGKCGKCESCKWSKEKDNDSGLSPHQRHFCAHCGSALYAFDPRWPELVHPFASCIDTPLPTPPERYHIFVKSKPDFVQLPESNVKLFDGYPDTSLEGWHKKHGILGKMDSFPLDSQKKQ